MKLFLGREGGSRVERGDGVLAHRALGLQRAGEQYHELGVKELGPECTAVVATACDCGCDFLQSDRSRQ